MEEADDTNGPAQKRTETDAPDLFGSYPCTVDEEASLFLVGQSMTIPCRLVELSLNGCELETRQHFPHDPNVAVEIIFRIRGIAFRLSGVMNRTGNDTRASMTFRSMSARRRDDLMEVLRELEAKSAASAEGRPEPAVQPQSMSTEQQKVVPRRTDVPTEPHRKRVRWFNFLFDKVCNSEAASQPADVALTPMGPGEGSLAKEEGIAPLEISSEPRSQELAGQEPLETAAAGRERRTSPRSAVDTSALLHLVKTGSYLSGQILDLSLGGCRIRTTERFPVGIYTRVETEFRLQGMPLLLGGVVQAIHDRNHVGIRFLDMSRRKREQIAELMKEIEEMRAAGGPEDTAEIAG